mgnify:CR=1 FL=1
MAQEESFKCSGVIRMQNPGRMQILHKFSLIRHHNMACIISALISDHHIAGSAKRSITRPFPSSPQLIPVTAVSIIVLLFHTYQNGDVSALLLELCGKSLFDLLREAYLIPRKFQQKSGIAPDVPIHIRSLSPTKLRLRLKAGPKL